MAAVAAVAVQINTVQFPVMAVQEAVVTEAAQVTLALMEALTPAVAVEDSECGFTTQMPVITVALVLSFFVYLQLTTQPQLHAHLQ
jgi:hypothetical protein